MSNQSPKLNSGLVPKRGARPSPRSSLAAASPYSVRIGAPPNFIRLPEHISLWGNDIYGDCVTAEEAFAKACNNPEIFIPDSDVISWASKHGVLDGAYIVDVLEWMQNDGLQAGNFVYKDGSHFSVDWNNRVILQSAISSGPVKLGIAADQIEGAWRSTGGRTGWFATDFHADGNEDHCVSLCGYGPINWLAQQLNVQVPARIDGTRIGYALFTWNSIGIIDEPSMRAITHEAWLRQPTTVVSSMNGWQQLDNNPATTNIVSYGDRLYQLHNDGSIWVYTGTPLTGWQQLDNNPATVAIAAANRLYQLHNNGSIWVYTGTPLTGWQQLDNNTATTNIVSYGDRLYQLHNDGSIWVYTGTPLIGWRQLDNNPGAQTIAAVNRLYQLHNDGSIWVYTGTPMTGWQQLDNNPATTNIVVSYGDRLYQLHNDGSIWVYTGTPLTGWQQLDNNPLTVAIATANQLYQRHNDGTIWVYTGTPMTGWEQLDNNAATEAVAPANRLYQLHNDGSIWVYTGS